MLTCEIHETTLRDRRGYALAFVGETGETVCVVGQFDAERGEIGAVCDAINDSGLDEVHLRDVIEDLFAKWGPRAG